MKYQRFMIFQTNPKSILMIYRIIIFLLLFNLNFEKNARILQNNEYNPLSNSRKWRTKFII